MTVTLFTMSQTGSAPFFDAIASKSRANTARYGKESQNGSQMLGQTPGRLKQTRNQPGGPTHDPGEGEVEKKVVAEVRRTVIECKKRWHDCKRRTKEKMARKAALQTGGGRPAPQEALDHMEKMVAAIIPEEIVTGIQ
ncbi:hypothetical protein NDU88_006959 [Pleurodeles waltl]|uniref:Uncharacterized protein n=1 Tax=Pleurodeles waltl TaxID=8319 RepID=A0AAV7RTI9_PLEWA|nr:hypothetical protein NDU88_006959 [Pleurodeles waltl]